MDHDEISVDRPDSSHVHVYVVVDVSGLYAAICFSAGARVMRSRRDTNISAMGTTYLFLPFRARAMMDFMPPPP